MRWLAEKGDVLGWTTSDGKKDQGVVIKDINKSDREEEVLKHTQNLSWCYGYRIIQELGYDISK